jgi:hypothetical protein
VADPSQVKLTRQAYEEILPHGYQHPDPRKKVIHYLVRQRTIRRDDHRVHAETGSTSSSLSSTLTAC